MVKPCKKTLNESTATKKEVYEPCSVEIVLIEDDVIRTSTRYTTSGSYDDLDDWDFFDEGLV